MYCEECVIKGWKEGIDIKTEFITKDADKCKFKNKHNMEVIK